KEAANESRRQLQVLRRFESCARRQLAAQAIVRGPCASPCRSELPAFARAAFVDGRVRNSPHSRRCGQAFRQKHSSRSFSWTVTALQYFGTEGSTSSDQAKIPPLRLRILRKPALRRKSTASAERLPLRQCAIISLEVSSS